jgi:hypothetical protein
MGALSSALTQQADVFTLSEPKNGPIFAPSAWPDDLPAMDASPPNKRACTAASSNTTDLGWFARSQSPTTPVSATGTLEKSMLSAASLAAAAVVVVVVGIFKMWTWFCTMRHILINI